MAMAILIFGDTAFHLFIQDDKRFIAAAVAARAQYLYFHFQTARLRSVAGSTDTSPAAAYRRRRSHIRRHHAEYAAAARSSR